MDVVTEATPWVYLDVLDDRATELSWTDLDVMAGDTYCYQVRAVNVRGGEGPFSRVIERTAREPLAPRVSAPGAPDQPMLTAAPLPGQEQERIELKWDKPNENGWPIISYTLQVSETGRDPWTSEEIKPVPGQDEYTYIYPPLNQDRLTGGERRYFRIRAVTDAAAEDSPWSRVVNTITHQAGQAGPPRDVRAYPDDVLPGSVLVVTWHKPEYDGSADITGYEVQWSANGQSGWSSAGRVNEDPQTGAVPTRFEHTGLSHGTERFYRVAARNSRGNGQWSAAAAATTAAEESGVGVPSQPLNLKLTAGSQHINASWMEPEKDGGSPITGYRVQYREGRSGAWDELTAFPSGTSTPLHGMANGVLYQVRVAAVNVAGTSAWTDPESATPYFPPGTPRNLTLTPGDGTLTAKWEPPELRGNPPLDGYLVQYRESSGTDWSDDDLLLRVTGTEATITGLTNWMTYQVRVAAKSYAGRGDYTAAAAATPSAPPSEPQGLILDQQPFADVDGRILESIVVSWDLPANDGGSEITGYLVQYRPGASGEWLTKPCVTPSTPPPPGETCAGHWGDEIPIAFILGVTSGAYQVQVAAVNRQWIGPFATASIQVQ